MSPPDPALDSRAHLPDRGGVPRCRRSLFALLLLAGAQPLPAVQLRAFDPARHNRFNGFPALPVANPGFLFGPNNFTGLGWDVALPSRQFALVSPRHFVCAAHYPPAAGAAVRFLNAAGTTVDRTVVAVVTVPDDLGQPGDLALGTLDAALGPADGVTPFPYLNAAAEAHATGTALEVFGWTARAGRGWLREFQTIEEEGLPATRCCLFPYFNADTQADDCRLETGDSGSPSFARVAGLPALVGTHTAIDSNPSGTVNYDTYLPHYLTGLNALMAPLGHQMQPALPALAALVAQVTPDPPTLRQLHPATLHFDLQNPTAHPTDDAVLELEFRADNPPTSVAAPAAWTAEATGPLYWRFRTAAVAAAGTARFSASWTALPECSAVHGELRLQSSAAADGLLRLDQAVVPSYAAWSKDLADPGGAADPDRDGTINLLEYAFGGDPAVASRQMAASAHPLLPAASLDQDTLVFAFPRRSDAAARGIDYLLESSGDLTAGSWTPTLPPGSIVEEAPLDPPVPGFVLQTLRCPTDAGQRFFRVRVELHED